MAAGAGAIEPVAELKWPSVLAWRMARHALVERLGPDEMPALVGRLCGLHAQLTSSAELSLHARIEGLQHGVVERALWTERSLVKLWAIRGTLHLLPAAEYPLWQAALASYDHYRKGSWLRYFGFTLDELERLVAHVGAALEGRLLTREALADAVAASSGDPALGGKLRDSWGATLKPVSFQGQLCYAPDEGRNVRFTHPRSWLGEMEPVDQEQALHEVSRRYLAAYGPATREMFARWWGGHTPAQALRAIRALGDEVAPVSVEGQTMWMLAADVEAAGAAEPRGAVALVPAFDPYVIGAPRDAPSLLASEHRDLVYRKQGWISPVILVDGRMVGRWSHEVTGDRVTVTLERFEPMNAGTRVVVERETARLGEVLAPSVTIAWVERRDGDA